MLLGRFLGVLGITTLVACGGLLDLSDYEVESCANPSGHEGHGCHRCAPKREVDILNGCTGRDCEHFDNARVLADPAAPFPARPIETVTTPAIPPSTDPLCSELTTGRLVYVTGSTALIKALPAYGAGLKGIASIVYQDRPSCDGAEALHKPTFRMSESALLFDGTDLAKGKPCRISPEVPPDIGLSDVPLSSCPQNSTAEDEGVRDFPGPIQVFMFAVPQASDQASISAEAARRVFGFGSASAVEPWTDETLILRRHQFSGTQITIADALGIPRAGWAGVLFESSGAIMETLANTTDPAKARRSIAITSADRAESTALRDMGSKPAFRDATKVLAYQHFGQTCGFFPNAVPKGQDKRNVRDGHYALWSPLHIFAYVDPTTKRILDPAVASVVQFLAGTGAPDDATSLTQILKQGGLVPRCAMQVDRAPDGSFVKLDPEKPCGCGFEVAEPTAPDLAELGCFDCRTKGCPKERPVCRLGGCELR